MSDNLRASERYLKTAIDILDLGIEGMDKGRDIVADTDGASLADVIWHKVIAHYYTAVDELMRPLVFFSFYAIIFIIFIFLQVALLIFNKMQILQYH